MQETGRQNRETVERETVLCDGQSAQDELRAKVVSPHFSKNSATRIEPLKRINKRVDRQNRELADREKLLGIALDADVGLGAKGVPPRVREELVDQVGAREKVAEKVEAQNRELAQREKGPGGLAKFKTMSFG